MYFSVAATNQKHYTISLFTVPTQIYFGKSFEKYYFAISKQLSFLSLQDIIIGITVSSCPLLNYLILIGKIHIWDCRRLGVPPNLEGFKLKIKIKYQTEKYISTKNNNLNTFYKKWTDNFPPQ